ncbi:MAG: NAD(P)-dependent alcohol dehydrogenase [Stellaceae bacterium]
MKIEAAVTRAPHAPMSLEKLDLADLRDDEIRVRLVATGICHTDIVMRDQMYPVPQPVVLGHEGAGVVEAVGHAVTKVKPGDHVAMSFDSCGVCPSCEARIPNYCHDFFGRNFAGLRPDGTSALSQNGTLIHGHFFGQSSFASHSICHERNIVLVPSDVPLDILGPLGCGIQTGAGSIINALKVGFGQSLVVFGTGSVGLSAVMAARAVGAGTIVAVDRVAARLAMAKELGATAVVDVTATNDLVGEVKRLTGGGAHFTFETTGLAPVVRQALDVLAPRGVCGYVGAAAPGTEVSIDLTEMMTSGKTLHGIVEGEANPDIFIPAMIDLYRQGRFPFDRLITFYPFERINDAIRDSETAKVIKPVVRMPA